MAWIGIAFVAGACGGAAEKKPPQSPSFDAPAKAPEPPPRAPTGDGTGATTGEERQAAAKKGSTDVDSARRELEEAAAAGDCKGACRALGAMDRAAGRLCKISDTT